jgi:hypothetical protein
VTVPPAKLAGADWENSDASTIVTPPAMEQINTRPMIPSA